MSSPRSLFLVLASVFGFFLSPAAVNAQNSKSDYQASISDSVVVLRHIAVKHPGCVSCNDAILGAEEEYVRRHVKGRPTVESFYYQKNVDDVKEALENFWKERGIAVEVTTNLTQFADASRYVALEFRVYRKY